MSIKNIRITLYLLLAIFLLAAGGALLLNNVIFAQDAGAKKVDTKKTKDDIIRAGKKLYSEKKYEEAIDKWEAALSLDPWNKQIKKLIRDAQNKIDMANRKDVKLINISAPPKSTANIMSLDDCLMTGIKNSIQLRIAEKSVKLAEMRLWEARRNLLPKASIVYEQSQGTINGRKYHGRKQYVEGSYTLPIVQGAETFYIMKQAELNFSVVKEEYSKARNELILTIKKDYYSLAKSMENLTLQSILKKDVDRVYEMIKKQFIAGIATKLEFLNVSSQAAQVEYQVLSATSDVAVAELMLKQDMYMDAKDVISIEPNLEFTKVEIEYEKVLRDAFINRPDLKIKLMAFEYSKYDKHITKARGMPKIDLMGNWGLSKEEYNPEDNAWGDTGFASNIQADQKLEQQWYAGIKVGVPLWGSTGEWSRTREQWTPVVSAYQGTEATTDTFKFNLFDKLNYFSDKVNADIDFDKALQELTKIKQDINLEVREGCFNYEKAILQLNSAMAKVIYQRKDCEIKKLRREIDEAPDSEVIDSMIKVAQEEFGYTQALTECHITIANINKTVGIEDYIKDLSNTKAVTK